MSKKFDVDLFDIGSIYYDDLSRTDLIRANFKNADLRNVDLSGKDLRWADFTGADLRWADFRGSNMDHSYITDCNIEGADFSNVDLSSIGDAFKLDFSIAVVNKNTIFSYYKGVKPGEFA